MSSAYLKIINLFGNSGGFDLILDLLHKSVLSNNKEQMKAGSISKINLNCVASLIKCVSLPYIVYQKDFINEYGPKIIEIGIKLL